MSETKALTGVQINDAEQGIVKAVFATFDVIDADGDVTRPGAFTDGQPVRISAYGHASWSTALPVGKGIIRTSDSEAVLDGRFFLDTQAGRDTFTTIKELGELQQWSYGFDTIEASTGQWDGKDVQFLEKLDVHEVSPVLLGAGVNTRTLAVKAAKAAIPAHSTATSDASWDGPAMWKRMNQDAADLKAACAWVDSSGDPDVKSSYKFIHHMVSTAGEVGAANITACVSGCGVLNGGMGGTTIPDADRKGVWNHLARHIRDAGATPPPLKSRDEALSFPDHSLCVLGDVLALVDRVQSWGTGAERKQGRVLSAANHQRLHSIAGAMSDAHAALLELLAETDPNKRRAELDRIKRELILGPIARTL